MERTIVKATHFGELKIPGLEPIPCAVLEDGTRVLSERGVTKALGGKRGGAHWRRKKEISTGAYMPVFISANNLKDFIDKDLELALSSPIWYGGRRGGIANGVNAAVLPKICEVWLKARDSKPKAWTKSQANIAGAADILMRGLAHVGVIALVDEATGYQVDRDRAELQAILAAYISKELMPWTSRFPLEFYREMFRLRNWPFSHISMSSKGPRGPRYAGKLTNHLIWEQLPPSVLPELRRLNPANEKWQRKHRYSQFLTDDIGNPHLEKQVAVVTTLMKISPNWKVFDRNFNRAFPRQTGGEQQILPGMEEDLE